jgi:CRISPR-associated protein Cmr2
MTDEPTLWERKAQVLARLAAASGGTQILHPLAGTRRDVRHLGPLPTVSAPSSAKARALALWRALGEAELRPTSSEDSQPLEVRATAESALAGAVDDRALLLFTIASVQDFVAAARRTQDLWCGSYLFSYFIWRAMEAVGEEVGYDVFVLPSLQRQPLLRKLRLSERPREDELVVANLPNIFTALVPRTRARKLAERAETALWRARDEVFQAVKEGVEGAAAEASMQLPGDEWGDTWTRQRKHFLQPNVFWAIAAWGPDDSYGGAARSAGSLLGARKTLRQFFQTEEPEGAEKCTLCGVRASLPLVVGVSREQVRKAWQALATVNPRNPDNRHLKMAGRLRRGEQLCAVCMTKRLALQVYFARKLELDYHLFPSTASVATAPFVERVLTKANGGLRGAVDDFADKAGRLLNELGLHHPPSPLPRLRQYSGRKLLELDGQWLYPDAWAEAALRAEAVQEMENAALARKLKAVREAQRRFLVEAEEARLGRPSAYLAVVAADGDHMGEWIAGRKGALLSPEYHAALGVALRSQALALVGVALEQVGPGKLIYAGGDDVLALLPVEMVLPALRALRAFFRGEAPPGVGTGVPAGWTVADGFVTGPSQETYLVMGPAADLSAAVVFVHHSHPLSHAVEEARHALKGEAKGTYGRSAVAFRLLKRSGEPLTTGLKWSLREERDGRETRDLLELLQEIVGDVAEGKLSPSLGHDLYREGRGLAADLREPALRFLLGRRPGRLRHPSADNRVVEMLHALERSGCAPAPDPWFWLADLLLVARFLAGEE